MGHDGLITFALPSLLPAHLNIFVSSFRFTYTVPTPRPGDILLRPLLDDFRLEFGRVATQNVSAQARIICMSHAPSGYWTAAISTDVGVASDS